MAKVTDTRSILLLHGVQSSRLTWWRLERDLQDLGWEVHLADLLGHGSRNAVGSRDLTVDDLARDVLSQVPGPVDVLVGHSLYVVQNFLRQITKLNMTRDWTRASTRETAVGGRVELRIRLSVCSLHFKATLSVALGPNESRGNAVFGPPGMAGFGVPGLGVVDAPAGTPPVRPTTATVTAATNSAMGADLRLNIERSLLIDVRCRCRRPS